MNRVRFKAGKYRLYFKWCALPFSIALAALGLTPEISPSIRVIYASFMLIFCELTLSTMYVPAFGYSALAASHTASALTGIKTLYILCTATDRYGACRIYYVIISQKSGLIRR